MSNHKPTTAMNKNLIITLLFILATSFAYAQHLKPIKMKNVLTNREVIVEPLKNATYGFYEILDVNNKTTESKDGTFYSYTTPETTILVFEYYDKHKLKTMSYAISNPWEIMNIDGDDIITVQDEYSLAFIAPSFNNFVSITVQDKNNGSIYIFEVKTTPIWETTADKMMAKIIDKL